MKADLRFADESASFRPVEVVIKLESRKEYEMLCEMFARVVDIPELMFQKDRTFKEWQVLMHCVHESLVGGIR